MSPFDWYLFGMTVFIISVVVKLIYRYNVNTDKNIEFREKALQYTTDLSVLIGPQLAAMALTVAISVAVICYPLTILYKMMEK